MPGKTMRPLSVLQGFGLAALFAAGLAASALADGSEAERTRQLSHFVRQDCGACHGLTLKGGLGWPLLPETLAHLEAEAIAEVILDGIPGTPMPPWRGELSEADALWIARALKQGTIE
jgi:cytochrome c55X